MTIALGVLCNGGAVLAADSQETVQGYWKRRQPKVVSSTLGSAEDLSVLMAGAGRAGYVDALIDYLGEACVPADGNWHKSLSIIRSSLTDFHRAHVAPYQYDLPEVALVIAMQKAKHIPALFVTDRSTMNECPDDIAAVGVGAGHALTILRRVLQGIPSHRLALDAAIAAAVYAVHHTKHHVADCGDVTTVGIIKHGETELLPEEAISRMDAAFTTFMEETEPNVVGMLVGVRKLAMQRVVTQIANARRTVTAAARERLIGTGIEIVIGTNPREDE